MSDSTAPVRPRAGADGDRTGASGAAAPAAQGPSAFARLLDAIALDAKWSAVVRREADDGAGCTQDSAAAPGWATAGTLSWLDDGPLAAARSDEVAAPEARSAHAHDREAWNGQAASVRALAASLQAGIDRLPMTSEWIIEGTAFGTLGARLAAAPGGSGLDVELSGPRAAIADLRPAQRLLQQTLEHGTGREVALRLVEDER